MAKVECKELAGQPCVFAFVGKLQFDENGIVEIDHPELLAQLAHVKGYRILPEEPAPKPVEVKVEKKTKKEPVIEQESK